jgi:hypothetical protein
MLSMAIQDQMGVVKKFPEKKAADLLIRFVRAGTSVSKLAAPKLRGILGQARDWECDFDLPEFRSCHAKYIFPQDVCATPLKMDGFVISRKHRICVGIELTVPMEHNMHQSKLKKYENELRLEAERNKWTFYSCVLEVGARGWIPPSLVSSLNKLGLPAVNNLSKDLSLLAMKSSYIIWVNRFNREFSPWRLKVQRSCPLRSSGTDAGVVASAKARTVGPLASKQVVGAKPACQDNGTRGSSVERRVLVDGKWLREGKHSDNLLPPFGQALVPVSANGGGPKTRSVGTLTSKPAAGAKLDMKPRQGNRTRGSWVEKRVLVEGKWLREGKRDDNLLPPSGQALLPISANGGGDQKDVTSTISPLSSDANGEAEVSYESLQKMVQGLVKGLDDERKEISVEAATVLSVNPKQLMDECEELLAKIVDSSPSLF